MISLGNVFGIARAEMRLTRRLVRFWLFASLAFLLGGIAYTYYSLIHYFASGFSATVASLNPRYLIGAINFWYQAIFLIGLVFLGFDMRARDKRERMHEVLDSLPCSNTELVFGKFLGILIPSWVPLGVMALAFVITGLITGNMVEPHSLVTFIFLMVIPAFVFTIGLVFLVSLLLRHRAVVAIVLLAVMAGMVVAAVKLPIWLSPSFDFMGGFVLGFQSVITPAFMDLEGLLHRFGTLLAGVGLLLLAIAVHPRKDDGSRPVRAASGLVCFLVGAVLVAGASFTRKNLMNQVGDWRQAHEQRRDEPAPDIESMTASLVLEPGKNMEVDLTMSFTGPENGGESVLFTLNPDLKITEISGPGGALEFTHEGGLLDIRLPGSYDTAAGRTITIRYGGVPNVNFAYLDCVWNLLEITAEDGQIFLMGDLPHLFDRRYVALMPGVRWLPAAGTEIGRNDPKIRPVDFFDLDLAIDLPEGWTAVAAGRRHEMDGADPGRALVKFEPPAPVPEVALVASRFQAFSADIDDIHAELLLHKSHLGNVEVFEDAGPEILAFVKEKLQNGSDVGLDYPYDAITMVEVPNRLRGFGGGWRMDTTLAPPSVVMVKEMSFPTAEFGRHFEDESAFEDREGGIRKAKLDYLVRFFDNDFNGGNPFIGSTRNFFGNQTAAKGPEGLPLDFVFEDLSRRLVTDKQTYFSVFLFDSDMGNTINQSMGNFFSGGGQGEFVDSLLAATTGRAAVWDRVMSVSLAELDPWEDPPTTIDILTLKGGAMARSMIDELGREETGGVLAVLRENRKGTSFDREDVMEAARETGVDLESWLDVWIDNTDLPGFLVTESDAYRLEDSEDGSPRYQVRLTIVNEEKVPGLVKVDYRIGRREQEPETGSSGPVHVPAGGAVEVGLVSSSSPRALTVAPYLSLNRGSFTVQLPEVVEENVKKEEPFKGVRSAEYEPPEAGFVLVDDLDPGFSVVDSGTGGGLRIIGRVREDEETDQGLPVFQFGQRPTRWSRMVNRTSWGKYRHTMAIIRAGDGDKHAVFAAEIPEGGSYDLEIHMPLRQRLRFLGEIKDWNLEILEQGEPEHVTFDAANGESGWNNVGSFELAAGQVVVKLSNRSEGDSIMADAIRWVPAAGTATTEKPES